MRLLLVEDKDSFRRLLVQALADSDWAVTALGDPTQALEALGAEPFEVLVTDLRLPGLSGLELLKRAKRLQPSLRIVLMSAFGEPRDIVEALHAGADDFLPKPFDLDLFLGTLERLKALTEAPPPDPGEPWIAHSQAMRGLEMDLNRAADVPAPALFIGERGSGRARSARRLHTLQHPGAPFLNLQATLGLGSRSLAAASSGSLFISNLEELPESALAPLITAMEATADGPVRWMASCEDPEALPSALRLRFGGLHFPLPPLRERREDILPLFRALLGDLCRRAGCAQPPVDRALERELLQRAWPGNVLELAWRASQLLQASGSPVQAPLACGALCLPWPGPGSLESMLDALRRAAEEQLLRRALAASAWNPAAAAQSLGLTTRGLAQRLREYRISLEED